MGAKSNVGYRTFFNRFGHKILFSSSSFKFKLQFNFKFLGVLRAISVRSAVVHLPCATHVDLTELKTPSHHITHHLLDTASSYCSRKKFLE